MSHRCWPLALLVIASSAADGRAQVIISGRGYTSGMPAGRVRVTYGVALSVGQAYAVRLRPPVGDVMVLYTFPAVVLPRPQFLVDSEPRQIPDEVIPQRAPGQRGAVPPGNFRLPEGDNPARIGPRQPPPPEPAPAPPKAKPPADKPRPEPDKKPREPRELPRPPLPEDDPRAESARLIRAGQDAFSAAEYGRAAERFRQATTVAPRQPQAHFLLAQVLLALGKYGAAVDAIQLGLTLAPEWPRTDYHPQELYGRNAAEYREDLRQLDEVLRQHPNDPDLLFLNAYALWFDGRRGEARALFERARRHGADPAAIDRFLRMLPGDAAL